MGGGGGGRLKKRATLLGPRRNILEGRKICYPERVEGWGVGIRGQKMKGWLWELTRKC